MTEINENTIIKFLSGKATSQEAKDILKWKNQSAENKQKFREIEITFNTVEIVVNPQKYDVISAYTRVKNIVRSGRTDNNRRKIYLQVVKYAASIVLAVGLTLLVQYYFFQGDELQKYDHFATQSVETPSGAKSLVTLEDGTKIWLNANSKLTYPVHFNDSNRIVLLEGEGYFNVVKDKSRPFKVKTSDLSINVLGTVFNVKSYPGEGLIETTLIEGKVVLNKITDDNREKEILELKPNEKATFIRKEGILLKDEISAAKITSNEQDSRQQEKMIIDKNIEAAPIVAWKDNKMIFKNETFESIAVRMERRYGAKITFKDEEVKTYRFSGVFEEISIDQALKALQFASPFEFEIEQDLITIKK